MINRLLVAAAAVFLTATVSAAPGQLGAEASMSPEAVKARIKPVGGVCVQGDECKPAGLAYTPIAGAGGGARTGEQVYNAVCTACHGGGVAGAPKVGSKGDWGPRIAQGEKTMIQHALAGFTGKKGVMPAKGGCASCSDEEIGNAVKYMAAKSK
ncbi:MAG: c-type cytochrome [Pseudomonadota bacterium]